MNLKSQSHFVVLLILLSFCLPNTISAQTDSTSQVIDTAKAPGFQNLQDSLKLVATPDSLNSGTDSTKSPAKGFGLEASVKYKSFKKIHFNIKERKVFLFDDAAIEYGDIELKAAYIEIDFLNNNVYAKGLPDSTGKIIGEPVFTESGQSFDSEEISYNFDTKKGIIKHVITKDGEGYLHGEKIKKMPDDRVNVWHGSYTTCDLKHPHFEFRYSKAQVIPVENSLISVDKPVQKTWIKAKNRR